MLARLTALLCLVWLGAFVSVGRASENPAVQEQGWKIPPNARGEKNPLPVNDATLAAGKTRYAQKCQRCHGAEGKGDGPDADSDHTDGMDLTNGKKAAANPDGVVFYKIWHGRQSPRMPAFEDQLTKEQAWAIVAYVQTLRKQ